MSKNVTSEIQAPITLRKVNSNSKVPEPRSTVKVTKTRSSFGGSAIDVRSSFRTNTRLDRSDVSQSVADIRSSFRNNTPKTVEMKNSFRSATELNSDNKNIVRRTNSNSKTTTKR